VNAALCTELAEKADSPQYAQVLRNLVRQSGFADVIRGDRSMKYLGATAGFATAAITLVNNTALKEDMWLKDYSVLFNVVDVVVILYLCFVSRTSREWILDTFRRARID
jgi:hypothetical protein